MNTKTTLSIVVIAAITLSLTLSAVGVNEAYAKQSATITCTNNGGHVSDGECKGSENNNKEENCSAKNKGQESKLC
jgi:hypothetical protein